MSSAFSTIAKKLQKHFFIILIIIVFISYGQMLFMTPWEDDNALFFKLSHIDEPAGYLGPGILGVGPYKYTATFYLPIYYLFGYNEIFYFAYGLVFYIISCFFVYKVYSSIFSQKVGSIAGFLYASGFIASESFLRLFNSIITSISIILISSLLYFYWKFYRTKNKWLYFLAVLMFLMSCEFANARSHYLIGIIVFFEIIFLSFERPWKSVLHSVFRIIPFALIFYYFFILNGDSRSTQVINYFIYLKNGEFYNLYGLIGSVTQLVIPNWIFSSLNNIQGFLIISTGFGFPYAKYFLFLLTLVIGLFILINTHKNKIYLFLYTVILLFSVFLVRFIFTNPVLNLDESQILIATLGAFLLIINIIIYMSLQAEYKKWYLFLSLWVIINISAYSFYNPTYAYTPDNRYFAHSFFAMVGLIAVLVASTKNTVYKLTLFLVLIWGLGNIVSSFVYQNNIINKRSNIIRSFYNQLKLEIPNLTKGDVLYFDIADNSAVSFSNAVAAAQMPNTTSLAWRYGIDRYDIAMFTDFNMFKEHIKQQKTPLEKVHTFWYENESLKYTSPIFKNLLIKPAQYHFKYDKYSQQELTLEPDKTIWTMLPIDVSLNHEIYPIIPLQVELTLQALLVDTKNIKFPFIQNNSNRVYDLNDISRSIYYQQFKTGEGVQTYKASSYWQDNVIDHIHDNNQGTFWQPDRIAWNNKNEYFVIELKDPQKISGLGWVNTFVHNTPTKYSVDVSNDGVKWNRVFEKQEIIRIESNDQQVILFSPQVIKYLRMNFNESLNQDSPGISEAWLIPAGFENVDFKKIEDLFYNPLSYIKSEKDFHNIMDVLDNQGQAEISWETNKSSQMLKRQDKLIIFYDGLEHTYRFTIPAGGTNLKKIRLSGFNIPGKVIIKNVQINYLEL